MSRFAVAAALNWLVVAVMFGVGVHYLAATRIMPYHLQALDVAWDDLTPRTRFLMLTLMRGTGLVGVCTAVALAALLVVPFRGREPWSRWAILLVGATAVVPMLIGAARVRVETGAASPWWGQAALLAALGLAFWLTSDFGRGA